MLIGVTLMSNKGMNIYFHNMYTNQEFRHELSSVLRDCDGDCNDPKNHVR